MGSSHAELIDFLVKKYSLDGLKTLCTYLGVDYDRLDWSTRDSLARELILYLERNDRLEELQRIKLNEGKRPTKKPRRKPNWNHDPDQVFISYAQRNTKLAHKLANDLRNRGYEVWIAPESISPGEDWQNAIERGLCESGLFLLIMTASAAASYWVQEETKAAFTLEQSGSMRVIPLDVSHAPNPPVWWMNRQHISFRKYSHGLKSLLDVLDKHSKLVSAAPHAEAEAVEQHLPVLLVDSNAKSLNESLEKELVQASDEPSGHSLSETTPSIHDPNVQVDAIVKKGTEPEREVASYTEQISDSVPPLPAPESDPGLSDPIASPGEAEPHRTVTSAGIGRSNMRAWGWVVGVVVLILLIVWANSLLSGSTGGREPQNTTRVTGQATEEHDDPIGPTQTVADGTETITQVTKPAATIASILTPVPTMVAIQSWTNEADFSIAQGWDILVDADGAAGFEDGKFFMTNKKENLLYISLWDALGGNISNAVFSIDLIEPGKMEAPNAAGLVFGWGPDSQDPTFAFLVTKDGTCEFRQENNNRWTRVSQGQTSNFLNTKESQTVSLVLKDGHAYGFVNGIYCDDYLFPLFESGYIGVATLSSITQEDGSKGYFDNARLTDLP